MAGEDRGAASLVNVNVGVLGHVDSGKTNVVRVLSTQLSTAALDKNPQSQQRGITLDLGFSAFRLPPVAPEPLVQDGSSAHASSDQEIQVTLVDCPGHASLFKTILGGARIIDMVLLVVDVQKGLQPQTIESLVVAELAVAHHVVIALNKVDLVPERVREKRVRRVQSEIRAFLATHFKCFKDQNVPIIPVAAAPAAPADATESAQPALGIAELVQTIRSHLYVPERDASGPFSLAIDHCFAIQGNGTILTGTVLSGSVKIGDEIEIPSLQVVKKVKSMQMFKASVNFAAQGDRVGIRVNGLDASLVERGMGVTPRSMAFVTQVIVPVHQIALFQGGPCKTGGKFHATVGHTTVVAVATFFSRIGGSLSSYDDEETPVFDPTVLYEHVAQIASLAAKTEGEGDKKAADIDTKHSYYALLQLDQPILCQPGALVVCSRLDLDPKRFACRLAFHGRVQATVTTDTISESSHVTSLNKHLTVSLGDLRIGKIKSREGFVDKAVAVLGDLKMADKGPREVIGRDMFSKDVDWRVYANVSVLFEASQALGRILGPFGKAGKFRMELLAQDSQASSRRRQLPVAGERIILRFVKLVVLKAPVLKGKGLGSKVSGAANGQPTSKASKAAGNLLQDDQLLYPEAFAPLEISTVSEESSTPDELVDKPLNNHEPGADQEQVRGTIERLKGETTSEGRNPFAIVTGLFSSDQEAFAATGRQVVVATDSTTVSEEVGEIEKPFGRAGKVRVAFTENGGTLAQVGDVVRFLATSQ